LAKKKAFQMFDLGSRAFDNICMNGYNTRDRKNTLSAGSRRRNRVVLLAAALGLTTTIVASPPAPGSAKIVSTPSASIKHHWFQVGKASWYGGRFQGHRTATGERFDMNALTCAHRTLPLGSWVRVTNLHNQKTTFLRVNDRGPVAGNLIMDLSYAAAKKLGIQGLGKVKVEEVNPGDVQMSQALVASLPEMPPLSSPTIVVR
jgi:rare lipoprotein A